jgi:hypothetical protein
MYSRSRWFPHYRVFFFWQSLPRILINCRLAEQEELRLYRSICRLTSGIFIAGMGIFFAKLTYLSLPPSTSASVPSDKIGNDTQK